MDGNYESLARGVFEDEVRAGLASFVVSLTQEKTNESASGNHLVQCEGNGFGVNGTGCGNGFAFFAAMRDVQVHGLQDAFFGLLDGFAEAVDAGEIVAVGVVTLAFAFDGDGIAAKGHAGASLS